MNTFGTFLAFQGKKHFLRLLSMLHDYKDWKTSPQLRCSIVIYSVHIIALLAPTLSAITCSLALQHIRVGIALSTISIILHPCEQYEVDSLSFSKKIISPRFNFFDF